MVCGELIRWRIFGEWVFGNWHVGESLANLWRMVCGELTRWKNLWPIFGECLANGIWGTESLANLWPLFGESLANGFWGTDT